MVIRTDFVSEYTAAAAAFSASCLSSGLPTSISTFAHSMAQSGYTSSFPDASAFGETVIRDAITLTLSDEDGEPMDAKKAGETMEMNYRCLNGRKGLVEKLQGGRALGERQVLVIHGTEDNAVSLPLQDLFNSGGRTDHFPCCSTHSKGIIISARWTPSDRTMQTSMSCRAGLISSPLHTRKKLI